MEEMDFKTWVKQSKEALSRLKEINPKNKELFGERLLEYIQLRFLLPERPKLKDNLYNLAEQSVAQIARLSSEQLSAMEDMSGCTGAKSAMVKKVLLLMSLKEQLHWEIDEETISKIERAADLLELSGRS